MVGQGHAATCIVSSSGRPGGPDLAQCSRHRLCQEINGHRAVLGFREQGAEAVRRPPADGTSGITGALAALTQYFSTSPNVTPQTDCGLDLGWTHANATNSAKSVNNTAVCLGALRVSEMV